MYKLIEGIEVSLSVSFVHGLSERRATHERILAVARQKMSARWDHKLVAVLFNIALVLFLVGLYKVQDYIPGGGWTYVWLWGIGLAPLVTGFVRFFLMAWTSRATSRILPKGFEGLKISITLSSEGMTVRDKYGHALLYWAAIAPLEPLGRYEAYLFLELRGERIMVIPKSAFDSPQACEAFWAYVREHAGK